MTLQDKIYEISKANKTSHISSCITAVPLIESIYSLKKKDEPFILSNGHAGLALYTVLQAHEGKSAEYLFKKHGVHPNRDKKDGIWCSTGSLGQGLPIALGMALANRMRDVYVLTSDGEWAEGSMWESLRIAAELHVSNLIVVVNANGYSAYKEVNADRLEWQIAGFVQDSCPRVSFMRTENPEGYSGIDGHYKLVE